MHEDTIVGYSKLAAQSAILQTGYSRVLTAMPVLLLSPFVIQMVTTRLERTRSLSVVSRMGLQLTVIGTILMTALPCALALYPQRSTTPVNTIEEKFWNMKDVNGNRIDNITFDKGL